MSKNLVIVESPAKAKTIEGYLGGDYVVRSSYGHIRDLPGGQLAVDVEPGQYRYVRTTDHTSITLRGELVDEAVAQQEGFIA